MSGKGTRSVKSVVSTGRQIPQETTITVPVQKMHYSSSFLRNRDLYPLCGHVSQA